jgi:hypothetical protein
MMGSELVLPQNIDTQNMTERQQRASARRNAYANRWNRVTAVRADLYPEMLEAEVLWSTTLQAVMNPIFELENELLAAIEEQMHLENPDTEDNVGHLAIPEIREERHQVLYARYTREDVFGNKFNNALQAVDEFLKAYLKK